jgi:hypothetical protein
MVEYESRCAARQEVPDFQYALLGCELEFRFPTVKLLDYPKSS